MIRRSLTLVQVLVLSKLRDGRFHLHRDVGESCGVHYKTAAAWARVKLVALAKKGLVRERCQDGRPDGVYSLTETGRTELDRRQSELDAAGEYLWARNTFRNLLPKD